MRHAGVVRAGAGVQPALPGTAGVLQRKCGCQKNTAGGGACGACARKGAAGAGRAAAHDFNEEVEVPSVVHEVLRSPGQPLDAATRAFMESGFGHDFARVRVHTDDQASSSARAVGALAYAVGPHIAVRGDKYAPATAAGRRLLAHELAHVVQQSAGGGGGRAEARADVAARRVMAGQQLSPGTVGSAPVGLYRQRDGQRADGDGGAGDDELLELLRGHFRRGPRRNSTFPPIPPTSPLNRGGQPGTGVPMRLPQNGQADAGSQINLRLPGPAQETGDEPGLKFNLGHGYEGWLHKDEYNLPETNVETDERPEWLKSILDLVDGPTLTLLKAIVGRKERRRRREQRKLEELRADES